MSFIVRATAFEFRHRFWIIGLLFGLAFSCWWLDPVGATSAAVHLLGLDGRPWAVRGVLGVATTLVVLAAGLRTWGAAYLQAEVVHDASLRSERLVADGPYRFVRNPLYLGNILLGMGMGMVASRTGFVLLVVGLTVFSLRLIRREEAELAEAQGERFQQFRAAVPRLIPALRPRLPAGEGRPAWPQALAGEAWMWGFAAAMAALLTTLQLTPFFVVLGASLVLITWQSSRR